MTTVETWALTDMAGDHYWTGSGFRRITGFAVPAGTILTFGRREDAEAERKAQLARVCE